MSMELLALMNHMGQPHVEWKWNERPCPEAGVFCGGHLKFPNGLSMSIQWSEFNYSSSREEGVTSDPAREVEVAVIDRLGHFIPGWPHLSPYDSVAGWVNHEQLKDIAAWVAAQPPAWVTAAASEPPQGDCDYPMTWTPVNSFD